MNKCKQATEYPKTLQSLSAEGFTSDKDTPSRKILYSFSNTLLSPDRLCDKHMPYSQQHLYNFEIFNPLFHNVKKIAKHTLKILRCDHRKIFKECLAILQHEIKG